MFQGENIYKDVNIISTPLLYYIGLAFLKILGPGLISFRIYNVVINMLIAITIYRIFINLKIEKIHAILYMMIIEIIVLTEVAIYGATYNLLAIMFSLIGINLCINKSQNKYYCIKQGIIIFLILLSKQNIGCYYIIAYIIMELMLNKKGYTYIIKTFVIPALFGSAFLIRLMAEGILEEFISYTVLGLNEFSRNFGVSAIGAIIIDIILIIFIILIKSKSRCSSEQKRNCNILFIFGICMLPIGYPIADLWHMIIASIVLIICAIYTLHINLINELDISEKILKRTIIVILLLLILLSIIMSIDYLKKVCTEEENRFYLIGIESDIYKRIEQMENYLLDTDKKVIIASHDAGMYKINIGYGGDGIFDLPFRGNLGKEGENTLIDNIKKYNDTYLLMNPIPNWQESNKFRDYVENNYEKVGYVCGFEIYYIK